MAFEASDKRYGSRKQNNNNHNGQPAPKKRRLPRRVLTEIVDDEIIQNMSFVPSKFAAPEPLNAKRPLPSSQREATMVVEPSDESVSQVCMITACDAETARRFLRVKQGNIEQALNAIFEGEDITHLEKSSTWDEDAWGTDRDGNSTNLHPLGASAAPTRGPSPAPSLGLQNPKSKSDEDDELAKALAMSQQDAGMPTSFDFQQESGTITANGTETKSTFGPATKSDYDMSKWALVTTSAATEVVPDVPIHQRQQQGGQEPAWFPRLLKHLPDGDYTPNFITIGHAIPKVREAFLLREHLLPNYGFDKNWWNGTPITSEAGKIVHLEDNSAVDPDADKYSEFIEEVQRLTAFLDASARIYASTNALTQTTLIKNSDMKTGLPSGSLLELFLQSWVAAAKSKYPDSHHADIAGIFTTVVGTSNVQGMQYPELTLVDLETDAEEGEAENIHELLDRLLWDTDPNETEMYDNYIERPADVITIRVQQKNRSNAKSGLRDVPATLQLDKYLKENVPATRQLRQQMMLGKRRVAKIEEIERKLTKWQHPTKSTQVDTKQMLTHALGHFSGQNRRNADKADRTNNASLEINEPQHYPQVASEIEMVIASIDDKLLKLAAEKERVRKAISEMSKAPPPGLEGAEIEYKYTLRGVATKPNITYVLCHKSDEDVEEQSMLDADSTVPPGMQWWRLDYTVTGSNAKIVRSKMDDDTVLHAAEAEHNSVLLVYANDDANDADVIEELPEPLQAFIKNDNAQFMRDLKNADEEMNNAPPPAYTGTGWEHVTNNAAVSSIERDDADSTCVNTDHGNDNVDGGLPDYGGSSQYPIPIELHGSRASPPPIDVTLGPDDDLLVDGEKNVEMAEKAHAPLVPRPGSDVDMGGVSQDMGVGGSAMHVEDKDMK